MSVAWVLFGHFEIEYKASSHELVCKESGIASSSSSFV
jgi:hypothetical protein